MCCMQTAKRNIRRAVHGRPVCGASHTRLPTFTNVGVDFLGPFEFKCARRTAKRYGIIFTCLNIRAVHLEVVHSLDTSSCINAIRRFIASRGHVKFMQSDNGTNLIRAEKELKEATKGLDDVHIKDTLARKGITWTCGPTMAAFGRHI